MKIAIISHSAKPISEYSQGYLEMFTYNLILGLLEEGMDVTLFAKYGSTVPCQLYTFNFNSIDWNYDETAKSEDSLSVKKAIEEQHAYFEVFNIIRNSSFSMVHNVSLHQIPVFTAQFLPIPTLTSLHTAPFASLQSSIRLNQDRKNYYTTISHELNTLWSPHTRINDVIYCGVDENQKKFHKYAAENRAIWIADVTRANRLVDVIQVCDELGLRLWIIGAIPNEAFYTYIIKPLLSDTIEYLGDLGVEESMKYLKRSQVMILTKSDPDYSGSDILKSLSLGTPVAAYESPDIVEFLNSDCGAFAIDNNPRALKTAVVHASAKNREDCRNFVLNHHTRKKMVKEYIALYRKISNESMAYSGTDTLNSFLI